MIEDLLKSHSFAYQLDPPHPYGHFHWYFMYISEFQKVYPSLFGVHFSTTLYSNGTKVKLKLILK